MKYKHFDLQACARRSLNYLTEMTDKSEGYEEPWDDEEPEIEESYQQIRQTLEIIYWEDED